MNQDPFKKEPYIRAKLDEYHVNIPDFPIKPKLKKWERFIQFLASPTKDPIEPLISSTNGVILLKVAPLLGAVAITLIETLLFI